MRQLSKSDWKKLRDMKDRMLALACDRILEKAANLIEEKQGGSHDTYLALYRLLQKEDKEIALMFDDFRKNTALLILMSWRTRGLLTDEDLSEFSEETRELLNRILDSWHKAGSSGSRE